MDRLLINDIMDFLSSALCDAIEESPEEFPLFYHASSLMFHLNDYDLKKFDDKLFDGVILEVIRYLRS